MKHVAQWADHIRKEVEKSFFGKEQILDLCLTALLCRGHVLLEDVPGTGKTVLATALAGTLGGMFKQIQCTPDLLPSDVLGVSVFNQKSGQFQFRNGPVVTNILLVDEINRATPRTQSALLEAMAEGQVSVEGKSITLPDPFFMIATQSPVDSEGTFPLPEVQKDRFFLSLSIGYPDSEAEDRIMQQADQSTVGPVSTATSVEQVIKMQEEILSVHVEEGIKDYIMNLITLSREDSRLVMGVSPRGSLALFKGAQAWAALHGRDYAVPEDVKTVAYPVLDKRLLIKTEYVSRGITPAELLTEYFGKVPVPGYV